MGKVAILLLIGIVGIFGLSYYKNETIKKEFTKELDSMSALGHKEIECSGLLKSDCSISNPTFKGLLIADKIDIKDLDPTTIPTDGKFKEIPVSLDFKGMKYSLWDLLSKKREGAGVKEFLKKYKQDYDLSADLLIDSDGEHIRGVKILDLKAEDKFIPYRLKGEVKGLEKSLIIKSLDANFDFSNKRAVFNDFVHSMRECCLDRFPPEYKDKSDDELYSEFLQKLQEQKIGISSLDQAIKVLSDDKKRNLLIAINAKGDTPLTQMLLPFLMMGPKAVDKFFDIKVETR